MVILSYEVSHDSVTDRRLRLRDNTRSHSDDTLVFRERAFQTPKRSGGLQHGRVDIGGIRTRLLSFRPEMQIGDDEVSWLVEYQKPLLITHSERTSTAASTIGPEDEEVGPGLS